MFPPPRLDQLWCETATRVDLFFIGCTRPRTWWDSYCYTSERQNSRISVETAGGVGGGGLPGDRLSPNQDGKFVQIVEEFGAYESQGVREGLLQEKWAADTLGHCRVDGLRARISPQDLKLVHAGKTESTKLRCFISMPLEQWMDLEFWGWTVIPEHEWRARPVCPGHALTREVKPVMSLRKWQQIEAADLKKCRKNQSTFFVFF